MRFLISLIDKVFWFVKRAIKSSGFYQDYDEWRTRQAHIESAKSVCSQSLCGLHERIGGVVHCRRLMEPGCVQRQAFEEGIAKWP